MRRPPKQWLMDNRELSMEAKRRELAKMFGEPISETFIAKAYYEGCRKTGAPLPLVKSNAKCKKCKYVVRCGTGEEVIFCESEQEWE